MIQYYAMATPDGAIQQTISGPYLYIACDPGVSDTTHYVDESLQIQRKKELEFDLSIAGLTATLTGLPSGLAVETNGMHTVTDDDSLVVTYDVPGTYIIRLNGRLEYLARDLEVIVDDA